MGDFRHEARLTDALFPKDHIPACEKGKSNFSPPLNASRIINPSPVSVLVGKCARAKARQRCTPEY